MKTKDMAVVDMTTGFLIRVMGVMAAKGRRYRIRALKSA
jgi:hypothetical protein